MGTGLSQARVVLWLLGLVACSCATPTEIPAPSSRTATLEEFCRARAEAECSPAVVSACQSGSVETCIALRENACRDSAPQGTTYVPENAGACLELVQAVYVSAKLTADDVRDIATHCDQAVFTGPGAARAPCTSSLDCDTASGLECMVQLGSGLAGKCLVPKLVASGLGCSGEADRCASGTYCDTWTRVCEPARPLGQHCELGNDASCQAGGKCVGSGPMEPGTCAALSSVGTACKSDDECADGLCDRIAASGNGSCAKTLELVPIAASCQGFRP